MSTAAPISPIIDMVWVPCGTCWGQRRIYEDRNGEGLVPCTCPTCWGVGEKVIAA